MLQLRCALLAGILALAVRAADSDRGEAVFEAQGCIQCHSVNGRGGKTGPDLGRRIGRGYTPATLAATIWNHAPRMWGAMEKAGMQLKPLSPENAADLVAFFSSSRFFDKPADAARGKRAFEANKCAECHGMDQSRAAGAPPVSKWTSLNHPLELAEAMWNHAARMHSEFQARGVRWPVLTGQDLDDILLYLRHRPSAQPDVSVHTTEPQPGKVLFDSKGCANCHTGALSLNRRLQGKTLVDIAAAMWNHAPQMAKANLQFAPGEMRSVVSYLWTEALNENTGDAGRGAHIFKTKRCAACHTGQGGEAPSLAQIASRKYSPLTMISAVWSHGPAMLQRMRGEKIAWPRFDGNEMSDLISFLNSDAHSAGK